MKNPGITRPRRSRNSQFQWSCTLPGLQAVLRTLQLGELANKYSGLEFVTQPAGTHSIRASHVHFGVPLSQGMVPGVPNDSTSSL